MSLFSFQRATYGPILRHAQDKEKAACKRPRAAQNDSGYTRHLFAVIPNTICKGEYTRTYILCQIQRSSLIKNLRNGSRKPLEFPHLDQMLRDLNVVRICDLKPARRHDRAERDVEFLGGSNRGLRQSK